MKNNKIVIDEKSHFDETCHFSDERTISKDKAKKEVNNSEKAVNCEHLSHPSEQ